MVEQTSASEEENKTKANTKQQPEQVRVRREKLANMREQGNAYPNTWRSDTSLAPIHAQYGELDKDSLAE
ncbi:MAG: hypothetical protein L3J61_06470, partial [Ghiorsea sp.]|nr:hypothetical protein [Ghiorsea sp.]